MALLGSSVDPRLFLQDYSGFTRAAEINAQAMQGLGQNIGKAISDYGDLKKEQSNKKKLIKQSDVQIDAAIKLFPDLAPTLQGVRDEIRNENIPIDDRAAIADSVAGLINMGTNQMRFQAEQGLREEQLGLSRMQQEASLEAAKARQIAAGLKPPTVIDVPVTGGIQKTQWDPSTQSFIPIKTAGVGITDSSQALQMNLPDPLKPLADTFIEEGRKNNIAPEILAAISMHETADGTSSAFRNKNNAMGVSDASGPIKLDTPEESIAKMARLLGRGVNEGTGPYANAKSIADIANIYAPVGAGNDRRNLNQFWTRGVASNIEKLTKTVAQPQGEPRVGFAPSKESQGTVMTQDQVRQLTSQGFKVSGSPDPSGGILVTGVQSLAPQKGQETIVNPDGTVTIRDIVTGGKQEGIQKAQEELGQQGVRIIASATENAFSRLDRVGTDNPLLAAGNAILAKALPASETGELQKLFERINGENSFEKMTKLRQSSPTGGAAGSMTEKEWPRFEDRFFNLNVNSRRETQEKGLSLNMLNAFEAANGTPSDIIKAKKEGKITQSQYDGYVTSYMMARDVARIPTDGIPGKSYEWTKLDKDLLKGSTIYESTGVTGGDQMPNLQEIEEIRARRNLK